MVAIAVALSAPLVLDAHLRAQGPSAAPGGATRTWVQQRTAWGHPDLQGVWNNSTTTPLEQRTREEIEQGRRAEEPVRAATDGTGAVNLEIGRPLQQPSLVVDPPDGRIQMTRAGVERLVARENARAYRGEADSWLDRNSWERCITRSMPTAMIPNFYNANYQIFQTPDHVAILIEMIHETRIIPLTERAHVSKSLGLDMGDARGRWDGNTLVVETTNFRTRSVYRNANPETLRLVERFTPTGPNSMEWSVTVDDPTTWTRPWTFSMPLTRNDQEPVHEYACHEGNYAMTNILNGSRAAEAAAKAAK